MAFVALVLPTFAMGGTLPVLARLSEARERRLGTGVGLLYAVNTAGAALERSRCRSCCCRAWGRRAASSPRPVRTS